MIELYSYPHREIGQVKAIVHETSPLAVEGTHKVKRKLTSFLETTYDDRIDYNPDLRGKIKILTVDRNLLFRMLQQLYRLTER